MNTEPEKDTAPAGPNPYIRTYAKDFASLSGKKLPSESAGSENRYEPPEKPKKKKHELLEKQSFQAPDESLIVSSLNTDSHPAELSTLEKEAERISDQQLAEIAPPSTENEIPEPINLPKITPGEIIHKEKGGLFNFHKKEKGVPELAPDVPENDFAHVYKAPVTAFGEAPSTLSADAEREAILARLKARLAAELPPTPVVQEAAPIPAPLPVPPPVIEAPVTILKPAPAPVPEPQPLPVPIPEPSPFHSFSTDFSAKIDEQKASTFSVLAAEKDAVPKKAIVRRKKSNVFVPLTIAVLLIVVGGGAVYAAYNYMKADAPVAVISTTPSLVSSNGQTTLSGSGVSLQQSLQQLTNKGIAANSITTVTLNSDSTETSSSTSQTSIFSALQLSAPDILVRNVDPQSTVGIINDGSQTSVFFVLRVDSYPRTFAGMLTWEPTMLQDLGTFYSLYPAPQVTAPTSASSSATSTPIVPSYTEQPGSTGQFMDEVVDNHDARALKDTNGNTLIVYGYSDKQTLIIARDETAFTQIFGRLTSN